MNTPAGRIVSIVCMAAVIAYTLFNYYTGRSSIGFVVAALLLIGFPMMNMIRMLIEERDET